MAGRLVATTGLMRRMNPIANCVITNVPGPQVPLYMTKARMVANYGLALEESGQQGLQIRFASVGNGAGLDDFFIDDIELRRE